MSEPRKRYAGCMLDNTVRKALDPDKVMGGARTRRDGDQRIGKELDGIGYFFHTGREESKSLG